MTINHAAIGQAVLAIESAFTDACDQIGALIGDIPHDEACIKRALPVREVQLAMFFLHHAVQLIEDMHDAYFAALEAKPPRSQYPGRRGTDF
jgi:hypothetical protein